MRYFFVSYNYSNSYQDGVGFITLILVNFPPASYIEKRIKEKYIPANTNICIQNIFEFKDEKDYNDFKR